MPMTEPSAAVARVAPSERIANLDVLRGIAILAILVMNIPFMGGYVLVEPWDPRLVSWTAADQAVFRFIGGVMDGTQRGLLELLFGAGMLIMARNALTPDGPVGVADLHYRRNLLLIAFGVFQALVLFWPGDILMPYGIVAIFAFAFRGWRPRTQALVGLVFILVAVAPGVGRYMERAELQTAAAAAEAKVATKKPLAKAEQEKLDKWRETVASYAPAKDNAKKREAMAAEAKGRRADVAGYAAYTREAWLKLTFGVAAWFWWAEILGTMLLGMALFKWGVLQGRLRTGVYVAMAVGGYAVGVTLRTLAVNEMLSFTAAPQVGWITWDIARLALVLGHVGLVSLALKSAVGGRLLAPFQAAGKMPLTIYLSASLIGMWILFPGFGFRLWGKFGHAGLEAIALAVMAAQLVFANVWLKAFHAGPLDWIWKSLAYGKAQPFRRAVARKPALAAAE